MTSPSQSDLVSILPVKPHAALPRTLFQNTFVSLISVQLKRGQRLHFSRPTLRLLTVGRGRVRMHGPNGSYALQTLGYWRLERGEQWKIRALVDTSLSLFIVQSLL